MVSPGPATNKITSRPERSTRDSRTRPAMTSQKPAVLSPSLNSASPDFSLRSIAAARTVGVSHSLAGMGASRLDVGSIALLLTPPTWSQMAHVCSVQDAPLLNSAAPFSGVFLTYGERRRIGSLSHPAVSRLGCG